MKFPSAISPFSRTALTLIPARNVLISHFHEKLDNLLYSTNSHSKQLEDLLDWINPTHSPSYEKLEKQFEYFKKNLLDCSSLRERIQAVALKIESTSRLIRYCLLVHQSCPVPDVLEKAKVHIGVLKELYRKLSEVVSEGPGHYYWYHGGWRSQTPSVVSLLAFIHFQETGTLLMYNDAMEKLGLKASDSILDFEDYCIGICLMLNELPRYAESRLTAGDYDCPGQVLKFMIDLHDIFNMLNLQNDLFRKKFNEMKSDLIKMEKVYYNAKSRAISIKILHQSRPVADKANVLKDLEIPGLMHAGQYVRFHVDWRIKTPSVVSMLVFMHWLETRTLLMRNEVEEKLRLNASDFVLDVADYLSGICLTSNELPKYVINRVTAGDYDFPRQVLKFMTDLHGTFNMFNLQNDLLSEKFNGMKNDFKKVKKVYYDVKIRDVAMEIESTSRLIHSSLFRIQGSHPFPEVLDKAKVHIGVLKELYRKLSEVVSEGTGHYYWYHGGWRSQTPSVVSLLALIHFQETGTLLMYNDAMEKLGLKASDSILDFEDYCIGICLMLNELPKYVVNRVTAGDYDCPRKTLNFMTYVHNELHCSRILNLPNGVLRKKLNEMKSDLTKVKEVYYAVKIRGLTKETDEGRPLSCIIARSFKKDQF